MSAGSAPSEAISMCQALSLDHSDTLTVLAMVGELDAGHQDGQLASPDEQAPPPPTSGGNIGEAPEPLDPEEFMGEPPRLGDETEAGDPGAESVAEAAYLHLAEGGHLDGLFELLRARGLSHLQFLDKIGWLASDLLPATELDLIGRELAGRPFFAVPRYFDDLFRYYAPKHMFECLRRTLSRESVEAAT